MSKKLIALFSILLFLGACDDTENETLVEDIQEEVISETLEVEEEETDEDEEERLQRKAEIEIQKEANAKVEEAIEHLEEEPSQENYDIALDLLESLPRSNPYLERKVLAFESSVTEYEANLAEVIEAVEKAEEDKSRESYNSANTLVSGLENPNEDLENRLSDLEQEIILAEAAAEEARLAQEAADRQAEEEAQASESSGGGSSDGSSSGGSSSSGSSGGGSSGGNTQPTQPAPPSDNVTRTVYIAPQSGTKYHYDPNCRGLSNANSVSSMTLSEAQTQGYDLCGWED